MTFIREEQIMTLIREEWRRYELLLKYREDYSWNKEETTLWVKEENTLVIEEQFEY